jgi:hypothetical protein
MRILNHIKVLYYSFLLGFESFGSDAKSNVLLIPTDSTIEFHRKNEKLRRGVKHLVKWMRSLSSDERAALIKDDSNVLMMAGRKVPKTLTEKLEAAKAAAKYNKGPRKEGEEAMADMFVKNQEKYKLQHRRKVLYRQLREGISSPDAINKELKAIRHRLSELE